MAVGAVNHHAVHGFDLPARVDRRRTRHAHHPCRPVGAANPECVLHRPALFERLARRGHRSRAVLRQDHLDEIGQHQRRRRRIETEDTRRAQAALQLEVASGAPVTDIAHLLDRVARSRRLLPLTLQQVLLSHVTADEGDKTGCIQPGQLGIDQARLAPDAKAHLHRPRRRLVVEIAQRLAHRLAALGLHIGQDRGVMRAAGRPGQAAIGDVGADDPAILVDERERFTCGVEEMLCRADEAALDHLGRRRRAHRKRSRRHLRVWPVEPVRVPSRVPTVNKPVEMPGLLRVFRAISG